VAALAFAAAIVAALSSSPPGSQAPIITTIVPTASERALFEQGRSAERIMFGLEQPQIFAIALLRDRSLADLTAIELLLENQPDAKNFSPIVAKLETLRPFIDRGDDRKVDKELWGSAFIEPYMSSSPPNPEQWWIVEAGMASVDADAARVDLLAGDFQSIHPAWLGGHISYAGRYSSVVPAYGPAVAAASQLQPLSKILASPPPGVSPAPGLSDSDLKSYQAELSNRLDGVFTERAFPAMTYGAGAVADGRRGVAIVTATQMIEAPALLGQRDAQEFIDELFASLKSTTDDADGLAALTRARKQFSIPASPYDYSKGSRFDALYGALGMYDKKIDDGRKRRVRVGEFAAMTYRNATIDRNPVDDSSFRKQIDSMSDLDAAVPGVARARHDLASAKSGAWLDIRAKSLILVNLIMGSS
jgi:hypothetical protein